MLPGTLLCVYRRSQRQEGITDDEKKQKGRFRKG